MANLVVFVRDSDDTTNTFTAETNYTRAKAIFDDTSELNLNIGVSLDYSFKNYINTISRGLLTIENYFPQDTSTQFNILTLSHTRDYYDDDYPIISEVLAAFENGTLTLPTAKLDNVESQILDCLMIIRQGSSNAYPEDDVLYPHKGVYGSSELLKNKYYVRNYVLIDSNSLLNGSKQGVVSHEFMHVIGYPDLYRNSGIGSPVGSWDIMASVSPYQQYPLSYMRHQFGWVPMNEITQGGTYTLDVATSDSDNVVFKIQTPMSDSEFFVFEYRVRNTDTIAGLGFETKVPESGLLMYRVNNAVTERSNFIGNDYIYVFRPNETSASAGAGDLLDAAINPADGETSYGSSDFSADISMNTLFYSSGKNSGITVSNVSTSADGSSIMFDIAFPDYSSLDLWDKVGTSFGSSITGYTDMDIGSNGNIYTTVLCMADWDYAVDSYMWNGIEWSKLGSSINGAYDPKIKAFGSDVYITYCSGSGNPVLAKYNGSGWTTVATISDAYYPSSLDIVTDDTNLYLTFTLDINTVMIYKLTSSGLIDTDSSITTTESFARATIVPYNGKFYAIYSYFGWNLTEPRTIISEYDDVSGTWSDVQILPIEGANTHKAVVRDGKLYVISGATNKNPSVAVFDGTTWSQETVVLASNGYTEIAIDAVNSTQYIAYLSNSSLKLVKKTDDGWIPFSEVASDCSAADFGIYDGTIYAAAVSEANENATVYFKQVITVPTQILIAADKTSVYVGETVQLTTTFIPADKASNITWTTGDPLTATVDRNGLVTARRFGNVKITATDEHGNTAEYYVSVRTSDSVLRVYSADGTLNKKIDWWQKYSDPKLSLDFSLYNRTNAVRFEWTSSNSRVRVDQKGNITNTGFFSRSATITLTAYDADGYIMGKSSVKVSFYKFSWQKDRLQAQSIVSDNAFKQSLSEAELEATEAKQSDSFIVNLMNYFMTIFKQSRLPC